MRAWRGIVLAFALVGGAAFGAVARAPAESVVSDLANLPYAAQALTAYDGYVVYSQSDAEGRRWRLMVWHAGAISALPVPPRAVPFDADAGPGANGQPEVVFSECAAEPSVLQGETPSGPVSLGGNFGSVVDWSTASGCRIHELSLLGGAAMRVSEIGAPGASDTTPTIWRGAIAFARLLPRPHGPPVPEIMLWRAGEPLRRLGGGPPPCKGAGSCTPRSNGPVGAFVASMDLGPHGLAVDWYFDGSNVTLGIGPQWQVLQDPLSGGSAVDVAADGFVGGACTSNDPLSPNEVDGSVVVYAQDENECEYKPGSPQFETSAFEPSGVAPAGGGFIGALAADGTTSYWLRVKPADPAMESDYAPVCEPGITNCTLVRSTAP